MFGFFEKKQAEKLKIEKLSLTQRGLHDESYFHIVFADGSERKEHDLNWSDVSEERVVNNFGHTKIVNIITLPVKSVTIHHNGKNVSMTLNKGENIYQAVRSMAFFNKNGTPFNQVVGRVIGKINNGEVVEELFIDGRMNEIFGIRK